MIVFDNVTKRYPASGDAISQASFSIEAGELVYVTGHSGAGKSTLLKLMAAIERPTNGTVLINNQNVNKLKEVTLLISAANLGWYFKTINCYTTVIAFKMWRYLWRLTASLGKRPPSVFELP